MFKKIALAITLSFIVANLVIATELNDIIESKHREAASIRDIYRNPKATLEFFRLKEDMTVVEIWPGGKGWYTEILAPFLKDKGKLYAAHFNEDSASEYYKNARKSFMEKLQSSPELYSAVQVTSFNPPVYIDIAPEGSVDLVLTFRNIHNWYMRGGGDERLLSAFKAFYKALKPGGLLGLVEHRLADSRSLSEQEASGYMRQDYVTSMAKQAGFSLIEESDINRNTKDTSDHPKGVWTLPPSLRLGEENKAHYLAIGESDRMTLLFQKPSN
jgi:predicted methyltransferase